MAIKPGTVALLKSSQEPVFVLELVQGDAGILSNVQAVVRRPVEGNAGISHMIERFYIEELETLEERHTRQIAEMEEMKARFSPRSDLPIPNDTFQPN